MSFIHLKFQTATELFNLPQLSPILLELFDNYSLEIWGFLNLSLLAIIPFESQVHESKTFFSLNFL